MDSYTGLLNEQSVILGDPTLELSLEAAKVIISDIVTSLSRLGKTKYSLYKNKRTLDQHKLTEAIKSIQMVKTIWQSQKSVSLLEFYYPMKVAIGQEKKVVETFQDFNTSNIVLISGTVGQGKSILLRHICLNEFTLNHSVVVFLECRHLGDKKIKEAILDELSLYGFDVENENVVDMLFRSGKLLVALDGFDELKDKDIEAFLSALNFLKKEYAQFKVIMTSRPDTDIFSNIFTESFELQYLEENELPHIINKLCVYNSDINVDDLILQINTSSSKIISLLVTPLLLSLVLTIYNATEEIPEQFSELYNELFVVLLKKHDKTKPGFKRDLRSGLNDSKLQKLFSTFCFISKKEETISYKLSEIIILLNKTINNPQATYNADELLYDFTMGTNLIILDGRRYTFIHKSIQEYFTAEFIISLPSERLPEFAEVILKKYKRWEQELKFIKEIDEYTYMKYFLVPLYDDFFNYLGCKDIEKINFNEVVENCISAFVCQVHVLDHKIQNMILIPPKNGLITTSTFNLELTDFLTTIIKQYYMKTINQLILDSKDVLIYGSTMYDINLNVLLKLQSQSIDINAKCKLMIERQLQSYKGTLEAINTKENRVEALVSFLEN